MWTSRTARLGALALGLSAVALDYAAVRDPALPYPRFLVGLTAVVVAAHLATRGRAWADGLGFRRLAPDEVRWLVRLLVVAGAAAALTLAGLAAAVAIHGAPLWRPRFPGGVARYAVFAILVWPVYEEMVYRLALMPGAVAALGRWPGYALGVAAFAYLHVLYGVFDVSNVFGAFALTLVFVRTGSVQLTIALHALGNAAIVVANLMMAAMA